MLEEELEEEEQAKAARVPLVVLQRTWKTIPIGPFAKPATSASAVMTIILFTNASTVHPAMTHPTTGPHT